jgi:hypothetical protein
MGKINGVTLAAFGLLAVFLYDGWKPEYTSYTSRLGIRGYQEV